MAHIEIKNRWTGEVLYECKAENLSEALQKAIKDGAWLNGACLDGASLDGARWNDETKWPEGAICISRPPATINGLRWPVAAYGSHLKIGCQMHTYKRWESFSDGCIAKMDDHAIDFWRRWKDVLLSFRDEEAERVFDNKSAE